MAQMDDKNQEELNPPYRLYLPHTPSRCSLMSVGALSHTFEVQSDVGIRLLV